MFFSQQCVPNATLNPCIFEFVYLARPDSVIDGISVYETRLRMGESLADKIKRQHRHLDIDVVIPIPDSSRPSAMELSKRLNLPYREGFIKNRYIGRTFIMPGQAIRRKSVRQKLNAIGMEFKGKNVLLVDDSVVRGNTSREIVQMAREAGARKVFFASAAPPVRHPNVYGIDMPTREELIAFGRTEPEIAREIGCDELIYQDLDGAARGRAQRQPEGRQFRGLVLQRGLRHRRRDAGLPRRRGGEAPRRREDDPDRRGERASSTSGWRRSRVSDGTA